MYSDQKRALLAVLLSGLVLFGWQYYMSPNTAQNPNDTFLSNKSGISNSITVTEKDNVGTAMTDNNETVVTPIKLETFKIKNGNSEVILNQKLEILHFAGKNTIKNLEDTFDSSNILRIIFLRNNIESLFSLVSSTEKSILLVDDKNLVKLQINLNESGVLNFNFANLSNEVVKFIFKSSPSLDSNLKREFTYYLSKFHHESIGASFENDGIVQWVGLDYNYHFFGLSFPDRKTPSRIQGFDNSQMSIIPSILEGKLDFNLVFVKKEYEFLKKLGNGLHLTVDFGFLSFIAVPILWLLKFFYGIFSNYGLAIILLTLLIRLITFPLQLSSIKGMKKMQGIQPEIALIKEKFKDNPQQLQKETMDVFKKNGVNPLSGCFPLLLQMPVFFALYTVLYNAVELVGAPFVFWIADLSIKDHFYVLPILMTASMFYQQKITPNAMTDKVQQKIMLFMPVVFGFLMKDLPSGLNLYIFVSTVAGIIQQIVVFKNIK